MLILDLDEVGENKKNVLHADIFMGESHSSIVRRTKQNAATLGITGCLGAIVGVPMAGGVQYAHLRLR